MGGFGHGHGVGVTDDAAAQWPPIQRVIECHELGQQQGQTIKIDTVRSYRDLVTKKMMPGASGGRDIARSGISGATCGGLEGRIGYATRLLRGICFSGFQRHM